MIIKFKGSVRELHKILKKLRVAGKFKKLSKKHWQYHAFSEAVLNFYTSTNTIFIQGPEEEKLELECLIIDYASKDIFHNLETPWFLKQKKDC